MKYLRFIIAIIIGLLVGGSVNMFIVMQGSLPSGVNMQNLSENMHLLEAKHYVFPLLGHGAGTFVGALLAAFITPKYKFWFALAIGILFLIGGIMNIYMLNFPVLPAAIDLLVAYIPMSYMGWKLSTYFK